MKYVQEIEKVRSMTKELTCMLSIYQHMLAHLENESYLVRKKKFAQLKIPIQESRQKRKR